jgi:hypothetical protein
MLRSARSQLSSLVSVLVTTMIEGVSCVGPAINGIFRIGQTVYAMIAVTEQAHDLLDSACHVTASVETVRSLRRQKSGLLGAEEKKWVDRVINDTEKTLNNVASLVEPARVDMQTNDGKIGLVNRALFVFRDSPKIATNFARLTLTSQSLNTALTMLSSREGTHPGAIRHHQSELSLSTKAPLTQESLLLPPSYQESEYLNRKRLQRSNRSSMSLRGNSTSRVSLVDPKPTTLEPVLASLPKPSHSRIPKIQGHESRSDRRHELHRQNQGHILGEVFDLSVPFSMSDTRGPSDQYLFSIAPQDPPYPSGESHDPFCLKMPEHNHYGYHTASVSSSQLGITSQGPPYPISESDGPKPAQQDRLNHPYQARLAELSCEGVEVQKLRMNQMESSVCLQLDQMRVTEALDEIQPPETSIPQRTLTARERRKQWYTNIAS